MDREGKGKREWWKNGEGQRSEVRATEVGTTDGNDKC